MATALEILKRSLRMIGELAEGEAPTAAQGEDALAALNGMLGAWEHEGVRLTLPTLALTTTLPLPETHTDAIAWNLAVRLAAEYGKMPSPLVMQQAAATFSALQGAYVYVPTLANAPEMGRVGLGRGGVWRGI